MLKASYIEMRVNKNGTSTSPNLLQPLKRIKLLSNYLFLASQDALEVMGVTESLSVSTDLTDVTLVSDDTF